MPPTPCSRFVTSASKIGLSLLRSEFLALERSVPKDRLGRINYFHVAEVIEAVHAKNAEMDLTSTAPECLSTLRSTIKAAR